MTIIQISDIARDNAHVSNELNVLVVGMPNVGKSTLLNALRNMGIPGRECTIMHVSLLRLPIKLYFLSFFKFI